MKGDNKLSLWIAFIVLGCALFTVGVLIGYFGHPNDSCPLFSAVETEKISRMMIDECKAENIEQNLRELSSRPHLAGTPAEKENAEMLVNLWTEYGFDSVRLLSYDVLLAYPDPDNPNKVMITDNGEVNFTTALHEEILRPEDDHPDVVPPFNAYSAQGEPEGPLVYVNYGRAEDFEWLAKNKPEISITGCIAIARYGKAFRGNKVLAAEAAGAIGVILYSDPADYAIDEDVAVYPDGWWLPDTGVQRGNTFVSDAKGDPVTPGYPAKPYMYRLNDSDTALPKIPVHPIGYGDAKYLLSELSGDEVNPDWAGNLDVTYRYGPGFINPRRKVKMSIHTSREIRTIYDVVGIVNGALEPDRYVLMGNHRDAWVYGAVDPSSGTAALMESARVYSKMIKTGWRPRRTVMFCSWGAEEYGLLGSTEFVEEYQKILGERAVAYINTDIAVTGNYSFSASSTPLLEGALYDAAKKVPDGETRERTIYDVWLDRLPDSSGNGLPNIKVLGSGSDFAPFMYRIGVPCVSLSYLYDPSLGISSYPLYHSVYETFYIVKKFFDYNFWRHQSIARFMLEFSRNLADSVILPFGVRDYATKLKSSIDYLYSKYGEKMAAQNINFEYIDSAITNFTAAATSFEEQLEQIDINNPIAVRRVNDQMMQLERAFIDPVGLPGRKWLRHVVYAPSSVNHYAGDAFPALVDAMYQIDDDIDQVTRWNAVREQMAIVAFTIQSAAITLTDVTQL
ncbi:putative N-acetylated-alpha-linked acidic dipeptidase [Lytechinus variegatus]|uniref:putative N-acetylated-alpha-linked acidic dipeptidase n=1 Tax=Lytechinus variegatus TaxID=7654 RepID=UPI001BB1D699|nr:putative N-acetylated-alpha-linked acidic dipeptidase [Lytechinus variegatus]